MLVETTGCQTWRVFWHWRTIHVQKSAPLTCCRIQIRPKTTPLVLNVEKNVRILLILLFVIFCLYTVHCVCLFVCLNCLYVFLTFCYHLWWIKVFTIRPLVLPTIITLDVLLTVCDRRNLLITLTVRCSLTPVVWRECRTGGRPASCIGDILVLVVWCIAVVVFTQHFKLLSFLTIILAISDDKSLLL